MGKRGTGEGKEKRGGLDWIGVEWIGLDWIGLDWIGSDWFGLDWKGLRCSVLSVVWSVVALAMMSGL